MHINKTLFLFLLLFASCVCRSQICSGSLGDPVVNLNFNPAVNTGNGLPATTTNYIFKTGDCPQDGFYSLVTNTFNCHTSTWHDVSEDHTPNDGNGLMMVVNASFSPGDFYLDTARGLCANTTYEFAAWILNVLKPSACGSIGKMPNLTFKIETTAGVELGKYNTGDIAHNFSPQWKQYGLFFTTPAGVNNVVLRLTNNAPGGCGNDLILDDITFRPCGPKVNASININGGTSQVAVCEGDPSFYNLTASVSNGFRNPAFQWQVSADSISWKDITGAVTPSYNRDSTGSGNYQYRLSAAEAGNFSVSSCRVVSNVLNIRVNSKPAVKVSVTGPVCEGAPLGLSAAGGARYSWTGPSGFSSSEANPAALALPGSSGKYIVKVTTLQGCSKTDSISLQVLPKVQVVAGKDETICEGSTVTLQATPGLSYTWSPATGLSSATVFNPVANPTDTTLYRVIAKDQNGCTSSDTMAVNVLKTPLADAGPDLVVMEGQSVTLKSTVRGSNVSLYWTPASFMTSSNTPAPTVSPTEDITYTLTVASNAGCGISKDDVVVRVLKKVIVPNAFSPNGDGINDLWNIKDLNGYFQSTTAVFNRYGQEVFRSRGYARAWDGMMNGKPVPPGSYYYLIDLKVAGIVLSGWVLLIR